MKWKRALAGAIVPTRTASNETLHIHRQRGIPRFTKHADISTCDLRGNDFVCAFLIQHNHPERHTSEAGKAVWNLMVDATSAVSQQQDDTAAAVATWAFLHGYAALEQSGAFGLPGPKGGLERGAEAFLGNFAVASLH